MPSLAARHPQIVHFAIALAVAGVLLRWLSLTGRVAWAGPAAAALLPTGAIAVVAAALAALEPLGAEFPQSERLKKRIDGLRGGQ